MIHRILFLCVTNSVRSQMAEGLAYAHFPAAVSMHDAARAHILVHCGEPDVGVG